MSISAVLAFYNRSQHIHVALESVFRQTLPADEIIVVNDGSRPEEAEHLRRYEGRAKVLHYDNRGIAVTRNRGIVAATSDWIALLDDDDVWAPQRLEVLSRYIAAHPECEAIHNANYILGTNQVNRKTPISREDFLFSHPPPFINSACMIKREVLLHYGLLNPVLRTCEDHELYMRMTSSHHFHCVDEPLTGLRHGVREGAPSIMSFRDRLYNGMNRVAAYYQGLYPDEKRRRDFAVYVNASMLENSLYRRAWRPALEVLRNCCPIQGISRTRVVGRALGRIAQSRLRGNE